MNLVDGARTPEKSTVSMSTNKSPAASDRISSGNEILDRKLGGGLRPGSLLAIRAPPASQSEALLYTLMEPYPTLFISAIRRESAVRHDLERITRPEADVEVASIVSEANMDSELVKEITGGESLTPGLTSKNTTLEETYELIQSVDSQTNVVLDSVTPLERSGEEIKYQTVLNELKDTVIEASGLGILHCIDTDDRPTLRERTLAIADIIWTVEPLVKSKEQKYHLEVSKNRGGNIVQEPIELTLDRAVRIDDTRNI
jgi:archaellum biogenesis ATPase FlaH